IIVVLKELGVVTGPIADLFAGLALELYEVARELDLTAKGVLALKQAITTGDYSKAFKDFSDQIKKSDTDFKNFIDTINGSKPVPGLGSTTGAVNLPTKGKPGPDLTNTSAVDKADFDNQLAVIKNFYQSMKDVVAEGEAAQTLSRRQGAEAMRVI